MKQLELFKDFVFDNRVKELEYAIKISNYLNNWPPNSLDIVLECSKLFKVLNATVFEKYDSIRVNK